MTESQPQESSPISYLIDTQSALLDAIHLIRREQRDIRRTLDEFKERVARLNAGIDELP